MFAAVEDALLAGAELLAVLALSNANSSKTPPNRTRLE